MMISQFSRIILAMFACAMMIARADASLPAAPVQSNPLVWDAMEKKNTLPFMTNVTYFTFYVTNKSSASAMIFSNLTSCDCTAASMVEHLPWELKPGDGGAMNVLINVRGEYGLVTRNVIVYTSHGTQTLTLNIDIPISPAPFNVSARLKDQMAAQKDRQAVFGEHCAACHAWPSVGRTGAGLFESACAICHVSDHRAPMVPDLATLSHETSSDYWRTMINFGKTNSMMPAFAKTAGGILDTNQIESLVTYLVGKYPAKGIVPSASDTAPH